MDELDSILQGIGKYSIKPGQRASGIDQMSSTGQVEGMDELDSILSRARNPILPKTVVSAPKDTTSIPMDTASAPEYQGKGRGLFGLPPTAEAAIFPKASDVAGTGSIGAEGRGVGSHLRQAGTGAFDLIGLLGRGVASTPAFIDPNETYVEALGRTEAKPETNVVGKLVSNTLRDPITTLMTVATGGAGAARKPAVEAGKKTIQEIGKAAGGFMGKRVAEAVPPAVARQGMESLQTGEVNIPEQAKAAGIEALADVAMGSGLEGLKAGVSKIGGKIAEAGLRNKLKPSLKEAGTGFDVKTVAKYDLGNNPKNILANSQKKIVDLASQVNDKLDDAVSRSDEPVMISLFGGGEFGPEMMDMEVSLGGVDKTNELFIKTMLAMQNDVRTGKNPSLMVGWKDPNEAVARLGKKLGMRPTKAQAAKAIPPAPYEESLQKMLAPLSGVMYEQGAKEVDLVTLNNYRKMIGTIADWDIDPRDPTTTVNKEVAAYLYKSINEAIGQRVPEVKALNQQLHELIPVRNAAYRAYHNVQNQAPVSMGTNIPLSNLMTIGPGKMPEFSLGAIGSLLANNASDIAYGQSKHPLSALMPPKSVLGQAPNLHGDLRPVIQSAAKQPILRNDAMKRRLEEEERAKAQ
jgi:hypothetical protein